MIEHCHRMPSRNSGLAHFHSMVIFPIRCCKRLPGRVYEVIQSE